MYIFLATTAVVGTRYNAWHLVMSAGPMVKFVMFLLILASIVCWAIMIAKYYAFRDVRRSTNEFLDRFYSGSSWEELHKRLPDYEQAPLAHVFQAGYGELQKSYREQKSKEIDQPHLDNVIRSIRRAITLETTGLEKAVYFLATTGSTAPFVGLFGTVWGIMNSFQGIGATGVANLAVVAPGISEALIATAMGLAAAIPAVVAYNYFQSRIRILVSEMENFASDFINIIKRNID
ncbi:MAG: protein TolQ [Deltaproteobacteria bacterium]|nr:protein TolQ [Deltaproteobacteria bacterium]